MDLLADYFKSTFQDFERYIKTDVDSVEQDKRLVLDDCISKFITYEIPSRFYTFKDLLRFP